MIVEANDPITTTIGPVVAKIDPPIKAPAGSQAHLLGIIYLSDYHIMDCPLRIHDIPLGLFPINDRTRTKQPASMKIMTSLNHAIHFHVHDGFRADELVYVEATTPWAKDGRALIHSRIFSHKGLLIATCVQEVGQLKILFEFLLVVPAATSAAALFRNRIDIHIFLGVLCLQRQCQTLGI